MFDNNDIIITSHTNKINLLKELNTSLLNIKIYTLDEFKHLYYFNYDEKTIYYIMNKYNVIYEIAKIYIDNMYNIEDKKYSNKKLSFLLSLKNELLSNKLLYTNPLFINSLNKKHIIFYNLPLTKELKRLIKSLEEITKVEIKASPFNKNKHIIYELNNDIEEVEYISNKICSLLKTGISHNHIFLTNLNPNYRKIIKRLFPMFNIPVTLTNDNTVYQTAICTKFFENYDSDLSNTIDILKSDVTNESTANIVNKIISVINKYTFVEDKLLVKDMIKYDLIHTKLDKEEIKESIHEVDLKDTIFTDEDYVFTLGFNQGILPKIYKDENYLTDNDIEELDVSSTLDKNTLEKELIGDKLNSIKNLVLTCPKSVQGEEQTLSSLNDNLNYEIEKIGEIPLENSNLYNKIKLTTLLDEFYKYGTDSTILYALNNTYKSLPYNTYNNSFTGINKEMLKEYLNNKLTLSYSSLDKYFRCPFSYYITKVLRLDIFEETFAITVGTLFHAILEKQNTSELSYDELWEQEVNALNYSFSIKEKFFLDKLKEELKFIIETINEQNNLSNLTEELHEEEVNINIDEKNNVTFTGIIDKVKYKKYEDKTIAAIIDYKTGNPNLDLTTLPYGIGMQLPIYLYLANNSEKLKNVEIAGFYLQKILNNEITVDNIHTYEQLKKKKLLLQGYSNSSIISEFDTSFQESRIVSGLRIKNDGDFYSSSKVLTSKEMDILTKSAEDKIKEGSNSIINADFSISPKAIGNKNYGCNLCKYKDICYHTNKDVVNLDELTLDNVLGGEK